MKAAEKDKKPQVEKLFGMTFTVNEELNKYKAPEYQPKKLAEIKKKGFKKIIHQ